MAVKYFKATLEDGTEYAYNVVLEEDRRLTDSELLKYAINSDIPSDKIDEIDNVEEIDSDEYSELKHMKIVS